MEELLCSCPEDEFQVPACVDQIDWVSTDPDWKSKQVMCSHDPHVQSFPVVVVAQLAHTEHVP